MAATEEAATAEATEAVASGWRSMGVAAMVGVRAAVRAAEAMVAVRAAAATVGGEGGGGEAAAMVGAALRWRRIGGGEGGGDGGGGRRRGWRR